MRMSYFDLPKRTQVGRVIPKNSFEKYTNTKQQRIFTDKVQRITWTNKLSVDTINLEGIDIQELQLFKIELKAFATIPQVLEIIDKSIPYTIIFSVQFEDYLYLSTSVKHAHPVNENTAVLDWTFSTNWFKKNTVETYQLNLKKSLDAVYKDFCLQISGKPELQSVSLDGIVEKEQQIHLLEKEIERLKSKIKRCKQFNQKVALNMELQEKESALETLLN